MDVARQHTVSKPLPERGNANASHEDPPELAVGDLRPDSVAADASGSCCHCAAAVLPIHTGEPVTSAALACLQSSVAGSLPPLDSLTDAASLSSAAAVRPLSGPVSSPAAVTTAAAASSSAPVLGDTTAAIATAAAAAVSTDSAAAAVWWAGG